MKTFEFKYYPITLMKYTRKAIDSANLVIVNKK